MISPLELQKLRDLPVEGVAERLGFRVSRHLALCPFHADKHPSLSFRLKTNTFRCFVCGASGGTIDLVMQYLHLNFSEACKWLADAHNVILDEWKPAPEAVEVAQFDASRYARFFEHPYLSEAARQFLFGERRLDPRVISWCRITSWQDRQGTHWLQTPYFDVEGRLIGVQNRRVRQAGPSRLHTDGGEPAAEADCPKGGEQATPRFRFPRGSRCSIYNLPVLKRLHEGDELYITEGCSDCWAMLSSGHKALAIPSATLLKPADLCVFEPLKALDITFHMYPDQDLPGERLFLQLQSLLPNLTRHQLPVGCKDYSEYYVKESKPRNVELHS